MKLTVREAAKVLNVSETKIYRWVDEDTIPFVMIQHHPMFHRVELLEWAIETEIPLEADLYEHDDDRPLSAALLRGGGHMLDGLDSIVAKLPVAGSERELIRTVIAARQSEMFRCRAADRIAIPRARSPLICAETSPLVMVCWSERSLVLDGVAVNALLVCVAPTTHDHLRLLSRLTRALHDRTIAAAVRQAGAFDQVITEVGRFESELAGART